MTQPIESRKFLLADRVYAAGYAKSLTETPKFKLSADFVEAVETVWQHNMPSSAALAGMRLPYPVCWVECKFHGMALGFLVEESGLKMSVFGANDGPVRCLDRLPRGEIAPLWVFALLSLHMLTTRNVGATEYVDRATSTVRRRLGKRAPRFSYHICKIQDRVRRHFCGPPGRELEGLRAHFVMGHWKVRKTGVFWWSPFVRGKLRNGFAGKDYTT
jgi:hypothetical protein